MEDRSMNKSLPVIAIDGPAGSGKSTIAKIVAKKLDLFYLDTGAMYRALALKTRDEQVPIEDESAMASLARNLNLKMDYEKKSGDLKVYLDGKDVSDEIRKPSVTQFVSHIAKIKGVRDHMVLLQRKLSEGKKAILEGRDIGTVVFPDAYKKFFLDASVEERVGRRYLELKIKDDAIRKETIREDIQKRDRIDSTREIAPLRRSPDAIYIDTTGMSIEEVSETIIQHIQNQ